MSLSKTAILTILLVLSWTAQPVLANQNLSFAVSVGDKFDFLYSYEGEFDSFDEDVFIRVRRLPTIPSTITSIFDCTIWFDAEFFFFNGTSMAISAYTFAPSYLRSLDGGGVITTGILAYIPRCLSVGNLTFLGELLSTWHRPYNTTILASENYWGFELEGEVHRNISEIYSNFDISLAVHADYTVDDGFLAHYSARLTNISSGLYYQDVSVIRTGLGVEEMSVITAYAANHTPLSTTTTTETSTTTPATTLEPITPSDSFPNGLVTLNPMASTLNMVATLVWAIVIVTLVFDFRRRKLDARSS